MSENRHNLDERGASSTALLIAALAVASSVSWGMLSVGRAAASSAPLEHRPVERAAAGYSSSNACQACHPQEYATWHRSFHRTMTQTASADAVLAGAESAEVDAVPGRPMRLERRGRELWADFEDPDWDGRDPAPPRIMRPVVLTTGSHNQQIYWYPTGRSRILGQLPAIWLVADGRWIPRRAAIMHPPGQAAYSETGAWNGICVACHTTLGKPAFDTPFGSQAISTQVAETTAAEFGIACEACHGPSVDHVRQNGTPQRRYRLHLTGRPDRTIVQPARLDPRRSSQVCGQCHAFWEFYDSQGERRANADGLPYRPGDELTLTRFIVQPTRNLASPTMQAFLRDDPGFVTDIFWSDGMVRATGREYNGLIDSPCFKNATDDRRTLSCFSCHTMHQRQDDRRPAAAWADDQLAPRGDSNEACLQCHERFRSTLTAHTRHRSDSDGSSCYNCHMPYTTYGLLKTIRSHQISSPSVQASLGTGRPNACNGCHLDKTLAWTATQLHDWYGAPAPALGDEDRSTAASLVALLKGDAGQRAIVAQSMGWAAAQRASGTNWIAPYVALLLDDPYDAVRHIAARSLRTLPGFDAFAFDFVAPAKERAARRVAALAIWRDARGSAGRRVDPALMLNADGTFDASRIDRLLDARNNRRVVYRE